MTERGSGGALAACAVVAVLVHVVVLGWPALLSVVQVTADDDPGGREPEVDRRLPEREIELGRPDARTPSVAWISYEDYRELVASASRTEQPAVQQDVDPLDEAPLEPEPTPPAPAPAEEAAPQAEATAELDEPPLAMQREADPPPLPAFEAVGELPPPPEADPADEPVEQDRLPQETAEADEAAPPAPDARPTAAPRTDAEADAAQIDPSELEPRPGGVIVGPGIEIRTARPQMRPSLMTAFPRNPTVRLYFNADGEVDRAEIVRSTGYPDWDGTILTSLYRWRAEGDRLAAADPHVMIEIQYLLHDVPD